LLRPLLRERLEIGFVWVSFFRFRSGVYFHKPSVHTTLRLFRRLQIGFVFSNRLSDSRFTIHASEIGFVFSN
jgi:hypothetical protein